ALHPPEHRGVIDLDPTLEKELCDVAVGETEPQVPAHLPGPAPMQQSRPNPFPAPHERFMYVEERFFDDALATFHAIFPDVAADQNFAQIASRLSFSLLDSLALNRIIDVSAGELEMVLEAFNAIVAPYFPATRRVSRFVAVPPVRPELAGAPPDQH